MRWRPENPGTLFRRIGARTERMAALGHRGSFSKIGSFCYAPNIVRHLYNKDPKRDHNLDNYP